MNNRSSHPANKAISVRFRQSNGWLERLSDVPFQVNLLALIVVVLVTTGWCSAFFQVHSATDKVIAGLSLLALAAVVGLNVNKNFEAASVLFYVALNALSLVAFRDLPGQPVEALLIYIFLFSLIIFLFQAAMTKLICMFIIFFRIVFFLWHARFVEPSYSTAPVIATERAQLIFDSLLLLLILLVFLLYWLKIYSIENQRKQDALFSQHMTHDLPVSYQAIASIIGHLTSKMEADGLTPGDKVLLNELTNASSLFAYVLQNFLEFSRQENGRMERNHLEEIDLESELENIVDLYQYIADDKGIRIALVLDDRLPALIHADRIKVIRIVLNLLTNAIKNTDAGKEISMTIHWFDGPWELSIANEGTELPMEEIRELFTAFRPKERPAHQRRLGLGLPITKQLVDALGGSITASTLTNRKTIFTVAFPLETKKISRWKRRNKPCVQAH